MYWFVFSKSLRWQNILVLVASYFFYGWWSWQFLGLLALSTLLDYVYGFWVASPNRRKAKLFLWLSIINNLGILGIFKYYDFFAYQFQLGFQALGINVHPTLLHIALPVGISFYTFHGMSYVFDIYRGQQKPVKNFVEYAVFVSFFPLLVAGPIERANHLLPQVQRPRRFDYGQAVEGCRLILWGLFKKVIIADGLATTVNLIFDNYHDQNAFSLIIGAVAFSFQIYGDFSGYSDIALGTAKLFGFELLSNFKFPYFSRDVAEFWRRWHISLSSWFRDYLYIPLGGSKNGKSKAVRNTFIIFLVSGFWHGASWNYIAWGGIHACGFLPLLLLNRNRKNVSSVVAQERSLPTFVELRQMILTFIFVTFAWIFFRAENLGDAVGYIQHIFTDAIQNPKQFLHLPQGKMVFVYILPLLLMDWTLRRNERVIFDYKNAMVRKMVYAILLFILLTMGFNESSEFIYFVF
jgi:alginate O-acetyltransferase complex protein AlgI